jgi:hypothetical protein
MVLKAILEMWDGGIDWIDLVQHKDRWQAIVKAVMDLWIP